MMKHRFAPPGESIVVAIFLLAAALVMGFALRGYAQSSSKDITVTNTRLPVADGGGSLTVDGAGRYRVANSMGTSILGGVR